MRDFFFGLSPPRLSVIQNKPIEKERMYEDIRRGWGYYLETFPFIYLRLAIYSVMALMLMMSIAIAVVMGGIGTFLIIFILSMWLYRFFFESLILRAEACHRAVIMALMKGERVPLGRRQLQFGRKKARLFEWHETGVNIENESLNGLTLLLRVLSWGMGGAFFVILLPPIYGLVSLMPHLGLYFCLVAGVIAWVLKASFVDAYVLAAVMGTYRKTIRTGGGGEAKPNQFLKAA